MSRKKHQRGKHFSGKVTPSGKSPEYAQAVQLYRAGQLQEAGILFQNHIKKYPNDDDAINFAGLIAFQSGNYGSAIQLFLAAVRLSDRNPTYHNNLGAALKDSGDAKGAVSCFQKAVDLKPDYCEASYNLGGSFQTLGEFRRAIDWYEYTLSRNPDFFMTHNNLACIYKDQGKIEQAIEAFQQVINRDPGDSIAYSNMLFCFSYLHKSDPDAVFRHHLEWAKRHSLREPVHSEKYLNLASPYRRIRVGYLSPDFRVHSVAFFIHPVIQGHDREQLEVFCYADVAKPDEVTEVMMKTADHWRNIHRMSDDQVFQCIQNDQIDILVDLAGHSGNNRMKVFTGKPAPVQVTYLGYPNTTGLSTMDYRITDGIADPPGLTDPYYTEELIRLPAGFLCYHPSMGTPDVSDLPCLENGYITFGSFNNRAKINTQTISLWSELLSRIPGSRLILKSSISSDQESRRELLSRFVENGIDESRIEILSYLPFSEHLKQYHRVDIALDTFPYNGTTTTCEALWMGVPVITQAGNIHASRVGASILGQLGLSDWIITSADDYLTRALSLANDIETLQTLRKSLRQKLQESSLMDKDGFVATMDSVYRHIWKNWCADRIADGSGNDDIRLVQLKHGLRACIPVTGTCLSSYILQENPDWLDQEIAFLYRILKPGMSVMDIGANYGAHTLAAGEAVGPSGKVWAVEPDRLMAACLSRSIRLNRMDQVILVPADASMQKCLPVSKTGPVENDDPLTCSDPDAAVQAFGSRIDFLRIHAENLKHRVDEICGHLPASASPLIAYSARYGDRLDPELANTFKNMGFQNFRLIPGQGILAPLLPGDKLETLQQTLFCCKPDRAENLSAQGLLVLPESASDCPPLPSGLWIDHLQQFPYVIRFLPLWQDYCQKHAGESDWRIHQQALSAYAASRLPGNRPWDRYQALKTAYHQMTGLLRRHATVSRILTSIRLAVDSGFREDAAGMLHHLFKLFDSGQEFSVDEPFLSVSARMEALDPEDDVGQWLIYSVLEARENFRALSSFFTGETSLPDLELMRSSPFYGEEMERRRLMIQNRFGRKDA